MAQQLHGTRFSPSFASSSVQLPQHTVFLWSAELLLRRGCATPLAPARGPRCRTRFELSCIRVVINSSWHVVARHSTFCQDTVQDTLLWLHPCGPTVDRRNRSTVGSGTREDVVTAYEMTVLSEDVYITPVPAVITSPALAALQHLRHRTSPCRDRSI